MDRVVGTEILDALAPADPQAVASRTDLRRLNSVMGHAGFFARVLRSLVPQKRPYPGLLRVTELGAGDGTLLLTVLRARPMGKTGGFAMLVDRHDLVSVETRREMEKIDWSAETEVSDVFQHLERSDEVVDVILANLFLHHFRKDSLRRLLLLASRRTNLFIACEPRRTPFALMAAKAVGLIGCNAVTRHDAVASVRAGFCEGEISALWPRGGSWRISEHPVGCFSQGFVARRHV